MKSSSRRLVVSRFGAQRRADQLPECGEERDKRANAALQASRSADAQLGAEDQAQVECPAVHEHPFEDVVASPEVGPSQVACPVEMREGTFDALAARPLQRLPTRAPDAAAIRIHRLSGADVVKGQMKPYRSGQVIPYHPQ